MLSECSVAALRDGESVPPIDVDFLDAGSSGPLVMLVHSSVSGARQWRRLMDDLKDRFRVRAVNLYGYGKTPPWPAETIQSLSDQAHLVEAALPAGFDEVYLVGHSFGGAVAMKAAAQLRGRVGKLVLLETNPLYLLAQNGNTAAFTEAVDLCNCVKQFGRLGQWSAAAEKFADYWGGAGTWQGMPSERRTAFTEALKPNFFEWDAVMNETTSVEQWAMLLPRETLLFMGPGYRLASTRDCAAPAAVLSHVDLRGAAGGRSHGSAHASGADQSACRRISGGSNAKIMGREAVQAVMQAERSAIGE
jgi:pimeloyl-ACP methyl ester carboxylesterase